ncbi:MAG: hypothetical protein ABIJ41_00860 [Candidatus Omnitrophota bacterium]
MIRATKDFILLHVCLLAWAVMAAGHLFGDFGSRSFRSRDQRLNFFLKERFDDKRCYVRWLKRFYMICSVIILLIYTKLLAVIIKAVPGP